MNLAAAGSNVVSGVIVEISQRNAWNAHVPRFGRLHRLAHDLRRVGDGNQVEVFAQGADQDRLPETLDGVLRLVVAMQPVLKRLARIGLLG